MDLSNYTLGLISSLGAVPVLIGVALGVGRLLKRKWHIPLGVRYKVGAVALASYLPLRIYNLFVERCLADLSKAMSVDVKVDGAVKPETPEMIPEGLLQFLLAVAIVFGALLAVGLVRRYFWDGWFERTQETRVPRFVSDIGSVMIVGVAILIVAQGVYRLDLSSLKLGSTVSVAVLGFASQDLLGNLLSGVALQIGSPFKKGDWLMVDGRRLQVLEVNWRATRMRSPDNVLVEVPNKTIAGGVITNLSAPTKERASTIVVGFEQAACPEEVKECLKSAALGLSLIHI
jgi:small-conductance mechanosensitive channel